MTPRRLPLRPSRLHEQAKLLSEDEPIDRAMDALAIAMVRVLVEQARVWTGHDDDADHADDAV